jgi:hypothetical protein
MDFCDVVRTHGFPSSRHDTRAMPSSQDYRGYFRTFTVTCCQVILVDMKQKAQRIPVNVDLEDFQRLKALSGVPFSSVDDIEVHGSSGVKDAQYWNEFRA